MSTFKVGDRVVHCEDEHLQIGIVREISINQERALVKWPEIADGCDEVQSNLRHAEPAPFKRGDRVEHIDYAPGFVMTVVADQYTSGAVLTEWPTGTRHTEWAKFLKHAEPDAPIDKTESICGGNIWHDNGGPLKAGPTKLDAETADSIMWLTKGQMDAIKQKPKPMFTQEQWDKAVKTKTRAKTLREAGKLIDGDRADDYDTKDDATGNFNRIAQLWSPILGTTVTATQVALCLTQLKVARIIVNPTKADSRIDAAGYIALGSEIAEQEQS